MWNKSVSSEHGKSCKAKNTSFLMFNAKIFQQKGKTGKGYHL